MIIIPAVDIRKGNCVRLSQGRPEDETIYSPDPLLVAKLWQAQGARLVHIVDLDGALTGRMENRELILKIAKELDIPVQVGGGIRDYETVRYLLEGGVERVIIGTSAVYDREFLKSLIKKHKDHLSVGIDSVDGKVAIGGWKNVTSRLASTFAKGMERMGVGEIIVTDIKKDGMLGGPNLKMIKKIAERVSIPVVAAGGISSVEDISNLKELKIDNLKGVIVGKALYRDDDFLTEAIRIAQGD